MPRSKQEAMRRKRSRGRMREDPPFPILVTGSDMSALPCVYFTGYLHGSSVIVQHSGDMEFLYNKGFFGKGNFSRSEPTFDSRQQRVNIPCASQGSSDRRDIVPAVVTSKRKYLAHLRYRALSDDEESEYNDVCLHEQSLLSHLIEDADDEEVDDEDDTDEEEDDEEEENSYINNGTVSRYIPGGSGGTVPTFKKLTPAELSNLPRQYLVALMTQVALLSKEQIATFIRVPNTLLELETKYKAMRKKQLEFLGMSPKPPSPGRAPFGKGFGKKGVINLEEGEEDPVVISNSDDSEDEQEEGELGEITMTKDKAKDRGESSKGWDDLDNEGDADFWGMGEGNEEEKRNNTSLSVISQSSEDKSVTKDDKSNSNVEKCDESQSKQEKSDESKEEKCEESQSKEEQSDESQSKEEKCEESQTKEEKSDESQSKEEKCEESQSKENDLLSKSEKGDQKEGSGSNDDDDDDDKNKRMVDGNNVPKGCGDVDALKDGVSMEEMKDEEMADTTLNENPPDKDVDKDDGDMDKQERKEEVDNEENKSESVDKENDKSKVVSDKNEDIADESDMPSNEGIVIITTDEKTHSDLYSTDIPENTPKSTSPTTSVSNDHDSSDDDVICLEEDSAKPSKLHQYLSQTQTSTKPRPPPLIPPTPIVTKSVCFVNSVTDNAKLTKVGFKSWDNVLHFNYSGDQSHLPTAMGIAESGVDSKPRLNFLSTYKVVYERIYPPVTSLIPSPDSRGSVIKQRLEDVPYLDIAQASLQHIFKTPHMVSAKEYYSSHLSLPHLSAGVRNMSGPSMTPTLSKNNNYPIVSLPGARPQPPGPMSRSQQSSTNSTPRSSGVSLTSVHRPAILKTKPSNQEKGSSSLQSKQSSHVNFKTSRQSSTKPPLSSSSPVDIKPPHLELYLEVFQDEFKNNDGTETEKGDQNESVEAEDRKLLQKVRVQLGKTGLLKKSAKKSVEVGKQESSYSIAEPSPVSVFNKMLSEYMVLKEISLEQELALLRVIMYERSTNSNSIPKELIAEVKSKLSPGQVSCLLERMDYVQNCLEGTRKDGHDEVITIDLSDEETNIKDTNTATGGKSSNGENGVVASDAKREGEIGGAEKDLELCETNDIGPDVVPKPKNAESDSVNGNGSKRKLVSSEDVSDEHQSKKLKSDLDESSSNFTSSNLDDIVEKKDENVDNEMKEKDSLKDNAVKNAGLSVESDCREASKKFDDGENIVDDESMLNDDLSRKGNHGDGGQSPGSGKNVEVKNVSDAVNDSEKTGKSQVSKNSISEADEDELTLDKISNTSGTKTNIVDEQSDDEMDAGNNVTSSVQNDEDESLLNEVDSDVEMLDSSGTKELDSGTIQTKEVKKGGKNVMKELKEGKEKNIEDVNEDKNEIYVGSSDEDLEGVDSVRRGVFPKKKTRLFSGNKYDPYSVGDADEGDSFVIANTSDEDEFGDGAMTNYGANGRAGPRNKWRPCLRKDPYPVQENLHLMLEEAFFLTYGLGCLRILDQGMNPLKITSLWQKFLVMEEKFIPHYVAYHYFRSKGWVPKSGLKFGCDFILYKEGPPFYHGSYSVVVVPVREGSLNHVDLENGDLDFSRRWTSWISLAGLNRITEHVSKELMLCYVIFPKDLTEEESKSPRCISGFKVKEVVVSRWVSAREREAKDQQEEMP